MTDEEQHDKLAAAIERLADEAKQREADMRALAERLNPGPQITQKQAEARRLVEVIERDTGRTFTRDPADTDKAEE